MMNLADALDAVALDFPFDNYLFDMAEHRLVGSIALTLLNGPTGSRRLLDVGAGACDKSAVLAELGFDVVAVDTFLDPWHAHDHRILDAIARFASLHKVDLRVGWLAEQVPMGEPFEIVLLNAVIEHLHDSPRDLLNECISRLSVNGHLLVTMPNSVNLRKRLDVLRGRTNYVPARMFFDAPTPWGGHVREWTPAETALLLGWAGLSNVRVTTRNTMAAQRLSNPVVRRVYEATTRLLLPSTCDTIVAVASRPPNWKPVPDPDPNVPTREIIFRH
jgi:2-polyprenyl-3-methyl-5-hydroxy-6-metoxy-1,4-benzoquinol methylase